MKKRVMIGLLLGAGWLLAAMHTCPADGFIMSWDGNTTVLNSQTFYEYKCPNGHTTLIRWDQQ